MVPLEVGNPGRLLQLSRPGAVREEGKQNGLASAHCAPVLGPHSLILSLAQITMRCLNVTWWLSLVRGDYCTRVYFLGPEEGKDMHQAAATSESHCHGIFSPDPGPDLALSAKRCS